MKTKINIRGPRAATYWNDKGEQLNEYPAGHECTLYAYTVQAAAQQLWIMAGQFGLLLETIALCLQAPAAVNPFLKS